MVDVIQVETILAHVQLPSEYAYASPDGACDVVDVYAAPDARGGEALPGRVANFLAESVRWSPCSRKIVVTTPQLWTVLWRELLQGKGGPYFTDGGASVWYYLWHEVESIRHVGNHINCLAGYFGDGGFSVPVLKDAICDPGIAWVVEIGEQISQQGGER